MKKRTIAFLTAFIMLAAIVPSAVYADNVTNTLGQIEDELMSYLEQTHPDIQYGTEDYIEYLYGILLENSDEKITNAENYSDILLYASEYIYQLNNACIIEKDFTVFSMPQAIRALSPDTVREQATLKEEKEAVMYREACAKAPLRALYSSFSAQDAVSYAKKYAISYNDVYTFYSGDCANFGSQSWVAGGVSVTKPTLIPSGPYNTTSYWYHIKYYEPGAIAPSTNVSTSFIRISDFYTYMINHESVRVTTTSSLSTLQTTAVPGDIVQLKSGGNYYHTIIITGGTSGNRTYCGHTINRYETPVSTLTGEAGFRIIHHN